MELLGHVIPCLNICRVDKLFSTVMEMFYILITVYDSFNFSTSSPTVLSYFVFDSHPWVFPGGSVVKTGCQCRSFRRLRLLDPWVRKVPGGGNGNQLQYCLEIPMDRRAWPAVVRAVARSWTPLSTHA